MRCLARTHIGTSGWHYTAWRDDFYHGLPQHQWLNFYCRYFNSVEINASFYRLQTRETYRHWHDATPVNFHFSLKGSRFLTHYKKLVDPLPSIRLERDRAQELRKKLDVVLWRLPASLSKNLTHLDQFVKALASWPEVRHAIEFRHHSWFDEEVATCLHTYRIAVCQSDSADWPMWHTLTADMVYVRLHGNKTTYVSSYDTRELLCWAQRVHGWLEEDKDVYVYFDNDAQGAAPLNAQTLNTIMLSA